jgi:hypothetical protein
LKKPRRNQTANMACRSQTQTAQIEDRTFSPTTLPGESPFHQNPATDAGYIGYRAFASEKKLEITRRML